MYGEVMCGRGRYVRRRGVWGGGKVYVCGKGGCEEDVRG